jgi:hypothetical protein
MTAFVILGAISGLQWQTIVGVFLLGVAVLVWSKVRERLQGEPSH